MAHPLAQRPRPALEIIGAALLLAIAGYGWQGSPGMPGKPVSAPIRQNQPGVSSAMPSARS